ncbi:MAG: hypothetical protein EXQ74_03090 [Thermoleophilia bacterium]|nr:hypothetical protein [Thermoleophilia bacterium]
MRRSFRFAQLGAALAIGAVVAAHPALGAIRIDGWGAISADMGGGVLVWANSAPATTKTFTYWRSVVGRSRVSGSRLAKPDAPVTVRTSAGPLPGTIVRATSADRGFTLTASGRGFAGPVIWCCTTDSLEVVVSSDGDGNALRPVAAGLDGTRVRWIASNGSTSVLGSADPVESATRETSAPIAGATGPGLASIAPGIAAWAEMGGTSIRVGTPADDGVSEIREIAQGGRVLFVIAVPGLVATVVTVAGRHRVVRTDVTSDRTTIVWTGGPRPHVALAGDAIAIGVGDTVLTSRAGRARAIGTATGAIAAVATDGSHVAVFERRTMRARAGASLVRATTVRIIGRVR